MADIWLSGTTKTFRGKAPDEVDVVVVGAGFSGLKTAYDLHHAGFSCVVLEANARIGGRSYTLPLRTQPGTVELGGTWINKDTQPDIYALSQKFGLDVVPQDGKGDVLWQGLEGNVWRVGKDEPTVPPGGDLSDAMALFQSMEEAQRGIDVQNPGSAQAAVDTSVAEWVEKHDLPPFWQQYIKHQMAALVGVEARDVDLLYFLDYVKSGFGAQHLAGEGPETAQALKIKQGTSAIATGLANALPQGSVLLNSAVEAVTQSDSGCRVRTVNGTETKARKVVIAIPTNTYRKVSFEPPLPEDKQTIVSRTKPGAYVKAMITYSKPWWQDLGLIGQIQSFQGPIKFSWETSDAAKRHYTLALFIAGDAVREWQALPASEREPALLNHLVQLAGSEHKSAILNPLEINVQDWMAEPYIGGGPTSAMGPGDYARYSQALRAACGDLHFAGGELAFEWKGYLEGALRSGSRAAEEVVQMLANSNGRAKL